MAKAQAASGATRRERVESKEGAIVGAAYESFATKGFAKSTIADIAKAAGVAEGTVYLYFKNKEALAGGVIAKFYDQLTETAQEGVQRLKTTKSKLEFLARHHLTNVIDERRILDLLIVIDRSLESRGGGAVYQLNKRYVAIFDGVIRDGVYRGDISESHTLWMLRDIFYGGLEYAMKTILITGREKQADKFAKQVVALIVAQEAKLKADGDRLDKAVRRVETAARRLEKTLSVVKN